MSALRITLAEGHEVTISGSEMAQLHAACEEAPSPADSEAILEQFAEDMLDRAESAGPAATRLPKRPELAGLLKILRPAPREVYLARMETCAGCEHSVAIGPTEAPGGPKSAAWMLRCGQCGCFMNFKARAAVGRCPLGKF